MTTALCSSNVSRHSPSEPYSVVLLSTERVCSTAAVKTVIPSHSTTSRPREMVCGIQRRFTALILEIYARKLLRSRFRTRVSSSSRSVLKQIIRKACSYNLLDTRLLSISSYDARSGSVPKLKRTRTAQIQSAIEVHRYL